MIICRAPFRISFFGGGTDFLQWYKNEEVGVISTTIDKDCYINVRYLPNFLFMPIKFDKIGIQIVYFSK